jgi:hypothetical protein
MATTTEKEPEKKPEALGLEDPSVWGDAADNPMDELADKSDNDLVSATRDLEAEVRKLKNQMNKIN